MSAEGRAIRAAAAAGASHAPLTLPRPCACRPPPSCCSARAHNNAMAYLEAHYGGGAAEGADADADLKPLLREGPVKGAIAAVQ